MFMMSSRVRMIALFLTAGGALHTPVSAEVSSQGFSRTPYEIDVLANVPRPRVITEAGRSFLRLAFNREANHNSLWFQRSDAVAACTVTAEFDFRVTPGNGRGDGLGFALLATEHHGVAGVGEPSLAEEPIFTGSLGIGFDLFQSPGDLNDNHVSVHFHDQTVAQLDAGTVDLGSGDWIHAAVTVDASLGNVSVTLTPSGGSATQIATVLAVPGLVPTESRVWFGARTGGSTADVDLDNVQVAFTTCPAVPTTGTSQDFDDPGTPFELYPHPYPPNASHPPLVIGGAFLRLAHGTTPPHQNSLSLVRTAPGPACDVVAEFDFRIIPGTGKADGLGFALLDTGLFDPIASMASPGDEVLPSVLEEPRFERSLGLGFDVYFSEADGDPNDNHVSVHFDKETLYQIDAGTVDLASGDWIHAEITVAMAAGTVSIVLTPAGGAPMILATDLPVAGLAPYEPRAWFGARSGGLVADHDLDNVEVTFSPCPREGYGEWSEVMAWPIVAIHAHLLPTGEVMFWDRHDFGDGDAEARRLEEARLRGSLGHGALVGPTMPRLWNPVTGAIRPTAKPPYDLFCSGHTQLADGRLFVAGGHIVDNYGLDMAAIYDPWTDSWESLLPMADGRWYPTATTLATGDVLVISGEIDGRDPANFRRNEIPEVWQVFTKTWRSLPGAQRSKDFYPFMFVTPDGRVLSAGWEREAELLDTSGSGSWAFLDTAAGGHRNYGSSVMLADGRAMIVGGVDPPTAGAELLDPTAEPPVWAPAADMSFKRRHLNATLLPDGTVLVTGGTSLPGFNDATGDVYAAELYDPATGAWSILAAAAVRRIYHSTALLLPDGRVLVAGSGHPSDGESADQDHFDAEVFSPPYLFRGPRPVISSVPTEVRPGETFTVETPEPSTVAGVTWLRPGSVTHAFNQNQRINRLAFTPAAEGVEVTVPATSNLSPPGYYMLFLLSAEGVPSLAKFVQLLPEQVFADGFETGDSCAWALDPICAP